MTKCEWCEYKDEEWLLYKTLHWSVYLADIQDYVGRCVLVLNRHCESLSKLNDFYKETTPNPHLHIHVRPRYKTTVVINNHTYADTEFSHHYALKKKVSLCDEDREILYAMMKKQLD